MLQKVNKKIKKQVCKLNSVNKASTKDQSSVVAKQITFFLCGFVSILFITKPDEIKSVFRTLRSCRPAEARSLKSLKAEACSLSKKEALAHCFPVSFAKFLRILFLQNTSCGCFWTLSTIHDYFAEIVNYFRRSLFSLKFYHRCFGKVLNTTLKVIRDLFILLTSKELYQKQFFTNFLQNGNFSKVTSSGRILLVRGHSFSSTYAEFREKLTFFTP